jgi:hypothetical protein
MARSIFRIVEFGCFVKEPIDFLMAAHKDNLWIAGAKPLRAAAPVIDN